jgi:hypothetical protein
VRHILDSAPLRAVPCVPSDAGVRTELIAPYSPSDGTALFLIETDSISRFSRTFGDSGPQPARRSSFSRGVSVVPDRLRDVFIKSAGEPDFAIGPTKSGKSKVAMVEF